MTQKIPLSRGLVALVDDEDYEWLSALSPWHATHSPPRANTWYAVFKQRKTGQASRPTIWMHRLILPIPAESGMVIDHINHEGLDNRRSNLRLATVSQNGLNRRGLPSNNTSGHRGVTWDQSRNRWHVQATIAGQHYNLGRFLDINLAIEAHNRFVQERGL